MTAVVPMREEHEPVEFWGALRELVELVDGVNLTASTSEIWVAERG